MSKPRHPSVERRDAARRRSRSGGTAKNARRRARQLADNARFYKEVARGLKALESSPVVRPHWNERIIIRNFLNMVNDALYYSEASRAYRDMVPALIPRLDGDNLDCWRVAGRLFQWSKALDRRIKSLAPEWC